MGWRFAVGDVRANVSDWDNEAIYFLHVNYFVYLPSLIRAPCSAEGNVHAFISSVRFYLCECLFHHMKKKQTETLKRWSFRTTKLKPDDLFCSGFLLLYGSSFVPKLKLAWEQIHPKRNEWLVEECAVFSNWNRYFYISQCRNGHSQHSAASLMKMFRRNWIMTLNKNHNFFVAIICVFFFSVSITLNAGNEEANNFRSEQSV